MNRAALKRVYPNFNVHGLMGLSTITWSERLSAMGQPREWVNANSPGHVLNMVRTLYSKTMAERLGTPYSMMAPQLQNSATPSSMKDLCDSSAASMLTLPVFVIKGAQAGVLPPPDVHRWMEVAAADHEAQDFFWGFGDDVLALLDEFYSRFREDLCEYGGRSYTQIQDATIGFIQHEDVVGKPGKNHLIQVGKYWSICEVFRLILSGRYVSVRPKCVYTPGFVTVHQLPKPREVLSSRKNAQKKSLGRSTSAHLEIDFLRVLETTAGVSPASQRELRLRTLVSLRRFIMPVLSKIALHTHPSVEYLFADCPYELPDPDSDECKSGSLVDMDLERFEELRKGLKTSYATPSRQILRETMISLRNRIATEVSAPQGVGVPWSSLERLVESNLEAVLLLSLGGTGAVERILTPEELAKSLVDQFQKVRRFRFVDFNVTEAFARMIRETLTDLPAKGELISDEGDCS
jgi:hypothetical protein